MGVRNIYIMKFYTYARPIYSQKPYRIESTLIQELQAGIQFYANIPRPTAHLLPTAE